MPQKTIYVKEENLPLYEKAEKIAGTNISNILAELLRDYVRESEQSFDIHAVCFVDEDAEGVPHFYPEFFVYGTDAKEVKARVLNSDRLDRNDYYVFPLFYATDDIKEVFHNTKPEDIVTVEEL